MTALCGGGTSGPKVGVAAVVDYSSGLIASILASRGVGWLIPVIPLAGLPPLILSSFCGSDPPAVPTFTSAETNALTQLQFGADFDSGLSKLADLILHSIWYDACQCTSGSLTTFPTVTQPAGTPIFQPPVPQVATPCKTLQIPNLVLTSGQDFFRGSLDYTGLDVTGFRLTPLTSVASAPGPNVTFRFLSQYQAGSTVTTLHSDDFAWNHAFTQSFNYPAWPGANNLEVEIIAAVAGGSTNTSVFMEAFCGVVPGGVQTPCCPPDTATQSYLDIILKMVTLIQRQAVPFAYLPSTTHPTLSGAGSFDISGLIGASIQVTTLPTPIGREGTSPTEYFDMGFVTFGTPDGWPTSYRLERDNQVVFPRGCGLYTTIAYDLHPGVVVTITELVREP